MELKTTLVFATSLDPDGFDHAAYQSELIENMRRFFGIQQPQPFTA